MQHLVMCELQKTVVVIKRRCRDASAPHAAMSMPHVHMLTWKVGCVSPRVMQSPRMA